MLALGGGEVSTEAVADVLWGNDLSDHWRGALRGVVSKLRNYLAESAGIADPLSSGHGTIRLEVAFITDFARAETLTAAAMSGSLTRAEFEPLRELALVLAQPFLIHNDSAWADGQRRWIETLLESTEHAVLTALRVDGRVMKAIAWAEQVIARNPIDVIAREALVELHFESDNISAVHRAYQELEQMLAVEFGTAPRSDLEQRVSALSHRGLDLTQVPVTHHHPDASEPFVGRQDDLAIIKKAWARVQTLGRPELVIVRGPAGVGKTRLADRAMAELNPPQRLWGRARPGGGRSWGPFADALANACSQHAPLARAATSIYPMIGRILPELDGSTNGATSGVDNDSTTRDSALAVARQIAIDMLVEPTLLVIDDLQWIGVDGLALLETVLLDNPGPMLVVASCRNLPDHIAAVLESASRQITVTELVLDSFDLVDLTELVRRHSPDNSYTAEVIAAMHHRTGGLPYFACALLREQGLSGDTGVSDATPESVTVWLESYLTTLSPLQRQTLEIVAVFGTKADVAAVEAVLAEDPMTIADTLDELTEAGLLTIDPRGQIRIPHDLTSWVIWQAIGKARRSTLHRFAGDHLAATGAPHAIVAIHWTLAGSSRHRQALDAHLEAGHGALRQGAWQSALDHFTVVQQNGGRDEPETLIAALIGSGRALIQLREHTEARETLEKAIDLADHHGSDHAMAEATLLLVGRAGRGAIMNDEDSQRQRLWAARERLGRHRDLEHDPGMQILLSRIETELAIALMFTDSLTVRNDLVTAALDRVRANPTATPNDLAAALLGPRMARIVGLELSGQIAEMDEILALPHSQLDPYVLIAAHLYRYEDLLRSGRRLEAVPDLIAARGVASSAQHDYWQWAVASWEALADLLDGDLTAAENGFAAATARRPNVVEAFAAHQVNLVGLRLLQGRVGEMIPTLQLAVDAYPEIPTWRAALGLALAESGHIDEAADHLVHFMDTHFEVLPQDTNRSFALGILAHVTASVGSTDAARILWDLLEPYRGQLVLINVYGGAGACWGPMEWALARIAHLAGRTDEEVAAVWARALAGAASTPVLVERIASEERESQLAGQHE